MLITAAKFERVRPMGTMAIGNHLGNRLAGEISMLRSECRERMNIPPIYSKHPTLITVSLTTGPGSPDPRVRSDWSSPNTLGTRWFCKLMVTYVLRSFYLIYSSVNRTAEIVSSWGRSPSFWQPVGRSKVSRPVRTVSKIIEARTFF